MTKDAVTGSVSAADVAGNFSFRSRRSPTAGLWRLAASPSGAVRIAGTSATNRALGRSRHRLHGREQGGYLDREPPMPLTLSGKISGANAGVSAVVVKAPHDQLLVRGAKRTTGKPGFYVRTRR